jgi:glycosyltransferase involved in cell wall biosynthesis
VRVNVLALCADPGIPVDGVKGASVHLTELWRALAGNGAQVRGVACVRGAAPGIVVPGVEVTAIRAVRAGDPAPFSGRILAAARAQLARPGAVRPDWILERLALDSEAGATLSRELDVPLIVEVNAPLDDEARRFRGATPGVETVARLKATVGAADLVVCVSEALVPWVIAHGGSAGRTRVLANGVRVEAFAGPRSGRASGAPARVAFVGSFKAWHGLDLLLDAWLEARRGGADLALDLLGDGPGRAALEARVRAAGAGDRVRFLGARPHGEVGAFLRAADIAVVAAPPDADFYFSPLKVYEYAAAGCAIVAPAQGQTGQRFVHGRDALLVPAGSVTALADALRLLASDPELCRRLGTAARARARDEFDWSHVARRLLAWARALVPAGRGAP